MKMDEFLQRAARALARPGEPALSDYALAPHLGITRSQISKYRVGKDFPSDDTALAIADVLKMRPEFVLACIAAERTRSEPARRAWRRAAAAALLQSPLQPPMILDAAAEAAHSRFTMPNR